MCDQHTENKIKDQVQALADKGEMFTNMDIYLALDEAGDGTVYREVREGIRQLWHNRTFQRLNYDRHVETMDNGDTPFVYHPSGQSSSGYSARDQSVNDKNAATGKATSTASGLPSLASPSAGAPSGSSVASTTPIPATQGAEPTIRVVRGDLAIEISAPLMEQVKRPFHVDAYCTIDNDMIVIQGLVPPKNRGYHMTLYTGGNARVPKRMVEKFAENINEAILTGTELEITASKGKLYLKLAEDD